MGGLSLELAWPAALWTLLAVPLLLLAVVRSRAYLSGWSLALVTVLRVVVIVSVALALSGARVAWPTARLAVAVIVDDSASISSREREILIERVRWMARNRRDITWLDLSRRPGRDESGSPGTLAPSIDAATALLPDERVRRVVVATDGRLPVDRVVPAIRRARARGVRVFFVETGEHPPIDVVAITGVEVPRLVRRGETATYRLHLLALRPRRATLTTELDRHAVEQKQVTIPAGRSVQQGRITLRDEGLHELAWHLSNVQGSLVDNDHWRSLLRVLPPPRVLLIREGGMPDEALARALDDSGLQVEVLAPEAIPDESRRLGRYQLVVLDEVDPAGLDEARQRAIREWVEAGGGLITVTGVNGVRSEPAIFREIEPVEPPHDIPETPPLELVLVIDRSGSMSGYSLDMARQAGIAAVRAMNPDARVGLVAFSGTPDTVIPPVDMSRAGWLISMIASLTAGGGTDIAAALVSAGTIMSHDPRYLHHIILLSDGMSPTSPATWAAQQLASQGVTISTIALGQGNALMVQIAAIGHGCYHVAADPSQLPRLFVSEARYRQAPPQRVVDFRPEVVEPMPYLEGVDFSASPPLHGYVLSDLRPGARLVLRSPEGDPILAHWSVGEGEVATFTSATAAAWASSWRGTQGFRRLWAQMAWDMLGDRSQGEVELRVEPSPQGADRQIITVATDDLRVDDPPVLDLARTTDPDQIKPLALVLREPGIWQVEVDRSQGFLSCAAPVDGEEPVVAVAVDHPYPEELRSFGVDRPALERLAREGGGRVLERIDDVAALGDRATVRRSLRLPLLVLALLAYLSSILVLRHPIGWRRHRRGSRPRKKAAVESNG